MNVTDAVKDIMRAQGVRNAELARRCSVSPQSMHERLNKTDMAVSTLYEISDELGYSIALVPKERKLPDSSYVVEAKSTRRDGK